MYIDALREAIRNASGGRVDARIRAGKRVWRVEPVMRCAVCGDEFVVKRANVTRCGWCIRHNQRKAG